MPALCFVCGMCVLVCVICGMHMCVVSMLHVICMYVLGCVVCHVCDSI